MEFLLPPLNRVSQELHLIRPFTSLWTCPSSICLTGFWHSDCAVWKKYILLPVWKQLLENFNGYTKPVYWQKWWILISCLPSLFLLWYGRCSSYFSFSVWFLRLENFTPCYHTLPISNRHFIFSLSILREDWEVEGSWRDAFSLLYFIFVWFIKVTG